MDSGNICLLDYLPYQKEKLGVLAVFKGHFQEMISKDPKDLW